MYRFIAKRVGISVVILFLASVLMFVLTINSGDPLADLRESSSKNRENLMAQRAAIMHLNDPWYVRYWDWLRGIGGCFRGSCDFGVNRSGQSVNTLLGNALGSTIRLVLLATILAIILGIFFGVMTAVRQYSGTDYTITFLAFVFYSLPSFVFAVLLKEYGAIRFNNWLSDPTISLLTSIIVAVLFAAFTQGMFAGDSKRRLLTFGVTFALVLGIMQYISVTRWFNNPTSGYIIEVIVGVAGAVLFTSLFTGLANRRALLSTLGTAAVMIGVAVAVQSQLWDPTWAFMFMLLAVGIAVAIVIGLVFGGYAKRSVVWACIWTAVSVLVGIAIDFMARYWPEYVSLVGGRPISTIGSETPNFAGSQYFWYSVLDNATHLFLPTISLTLMSVAAYTRYTRSSMLEVLEQDYVRTARSKGLPERMVITRHAFRNAMIPITTIVAFDFAGLIGGAVITENVFGWKGMGQLFAVGLRQIDPGPVMAFFAVTATAAVVMNMLADIAYAYIDPRIRR